MKILYIHSNNKPKNNQFYNDYMSDLLLHGLRDLYGESVVDYPGSWYLYSDEIQRRKHDNKKFWGNGFTIKNILNKFDSIDRQNINEKIRNRYFDLVIYSSIRRSDIFLEEVIKYDNKFIFVDGEDDNYIATKYSKLNLYFKRELLTKNSKILPINFAIPKSKIVDKIDQRPRNLLAPLIPGRLHTYIYDTEEAYYAMYKESIFALTYKKAGWDCLRHYEIMMNGCIPLFLDIKKCPSDIITSLPKEKFIEFIDQFDKVFNHYNAFKIFKKKHLSLRRIFSSFPIKPEQEKLKLFLKDNNTIFDLKNDLLNFTKKNLTTEILAKNLLIQLKKYDVVNF